MLLGKEYKDSQAVVSTPEKNGECIVLGCGYVDTQYGYIICRESARNGVFVYDNVYKFYPKTDESVFARAVTELDKIASGIKR